MTDERTRKQLARIHCLKRDLALTEDEYRDLLVSITGQGSAGSMTDNERSRVIRRMGELAESRGVPNYPQRPKNTGERPSLKKVEALLSELGKSWRYADGIAKKMYGVDAVSWCNDDQLRGVIAALWRHKRRRDEAES